MSINFEAGWSTLPSFLLTSIRLTSASVSWFVRLVQVHFPVSPSAFSTAILSSSFFLLPALSQAAPATDVAIGFATNTIRKHLVEPVRKKEIPWLDSMHDKLFLRMYDIVERTDTILLTEGEDGIKTPPPTFLLEVFLDTEVSKEKVKVDFDPKFKIDVSVPNLENRLDIFIQTISPSELPGLDIEDRDEGLFLGTRAATTFLDYLAIDYALGVKWVWPPELFAHAKMKRRFRIGTWNLFTRQKIFWNSDEGFGEITTASFSKRLTPRVTTRSVSAGKWSQDSLGYEWSQGLSLGYLLSGRSKDLSSELGVRAGISGFHDHPIDVIGAYGLSFLYRRLIYGDWLSLEIVPKFQYPRSLDYKLVTSLDIGLCIFFEGDH